VHTVIITLPLLTIVTLYETQAKYNINIIDILVFVYTKGCTGHSGRDQGHRVRTTGLHGWLERQLEYVVKQMACFT
jgi:hypothetical protein